jgi:hypothetical protein
VHNQWTVKSDPFQASKVVLKIENAFPSSARLKVKAPIFSMGNDNRITQQCESLIQDFLLISFGRNQVGWIKDNP